MPNNHYKKALAGVEDICFDTDRNNSTFSRETSTGNSQEITKLNANHIPVSNFLSTVGAESVEDFLRVLLNAVAALQGEGGEINVNAVTSDSPFNIPAKEFRKNVYLGFDQNGNLKLDVPAGVDPPDGPINPEDFLTIINDIKVISEASYTLLDSDTGKFLVFNFVGDIVVTSPDNLTEGWQSMFLKAGVGNKVTHVTAGNATHSNSGTVVASSDYALYSSLLWRNDGSEATYKFAGEIDATSDTSGEEAVSKTITIPTGSTNSEAQAIIDSIGKNLLRKVLITVEFEDGTYQVTQSLRFDNFTGPGGLQIKPSSGFTEDQAPKTVIIENIADSPQSDFAFSFSNEAPYWDALHENAAMVFLSNTCAYIEVIGMHFQGKVNSVIFTSNTGHCKSTWCYLETKGSFVGFDPTCALQINHSDGNLYSNTFINSTDGAGFNANSAMVSVNYSEGNGSRLGRLIKSSTISEFFIGANAGFTFTEAALVSGAGVYVSGGTVVNT